MVSAMGDVSNRGEIIPVEQKRKAEMNPGGWNNLCGAEKQGRDADEFQFVYAKRRQQLIDMFPQTDEALDMFSQSDEIKKRAVQTSQRTLRR